MRLKKTVLVVSGFLVGIILGQWYLDGHFPQFWNW